MDKKIIKTIKMETEDRDLIESLFVEYMAKQDLLNSIFNVHRFDTDDTVINSVPFQTYHKQFGEAKLKYDTMMNELYEKYIPHEYQDTSYQWEVVFEKSIIQVKSI